MNLVNGKKKLQSIILAITLFYVQGIILALTVFDFRLHDSFLSFLARPIYLFINIAFIIFYALVEATGRLLYFLSGSNFWIVFIFGFGVFIICFFIIINAFLSNKLISKYRSAFPITLAICLNIIWFYIWYYYYSLFDLPIISLLLGMAVILLFPAYKLWKRYSNRINK